MTDILIRNASWLATVDKERKIIRDASIAIEQDKIIDVGKTDELGRKYNSAEFIIDAKGKLVLPGLIDAHVHSVQQLAKGLADDIDIVRLLYERVYPFEAALTDDDAYICSLMCQLELIKAGTTCFFDPGSYQPKQVLKALGKSGLRAIVARCARDLPLNEKDILGNESSEDALRQGEDTVRTINSAFGGRIRGSFSLRILYDCSDELVVKTAELAKKYGVTIQTHGDADKKNAETSKLRFGLTGFERLKKLGALISNLLMIHMGGIPLEAIPLMKQAGVKGVSCPGAAAHSGGTTSPYLPEMLQAGLDICLGSDSASNNNVLDVVRAMNFASLSTKRDRGDAGILRPEELLEMATLNAAKAAFWDSEIGSIEIGKRADLTIFNASGPEWIPVHNPVANLVYCATGSSADTLIVDGKILMENRVVRSLDEEVIIEKANQRGLLLAERTGLKDKAAPKWPVI